MKVSSCLATLEFLALAVAAPGGSKGGDDHGHGGPSKLPLVDSAAIRSLVRESSLLAKAKTLQGFAFATEERNRVIGSPGHTATIKWLSDTLKKLPHYYSITTQDFIVPTGTSVLVVDGVTIESAPMSFTAAGHPVKPFVPVANIGCDAADYPATVAGNIALISRGTCTFATKSLNAKAAGAVGTVIYNNVDGLLQGTLGGPGEYVPTVGISKADGQAFLAKIAGGATVTADLSVILTNVTTTNVIAQTKGGDQNHVIHFGAHSDSVEAGPGINDNGSGSIGILEVALALTKFSVKNAVRFSWWAAEEEGLLGAEAYVASLPQSELDKIRLYLNFDMIASPNFKYGIYDGDGSGFNTSGPAGSAQAEHLFEKYFKEIAKKPTTPSKFDGRSDYGPFLDAGIACGGLDTGAEGIKTEAEAKLFGGTAGVAYDINYHGAGDTIDNLNRTALVTNTKAIAHAVGVYGRSLKSLDLPAKRGVPVVKRKVVRQRIGGKWVY